MPDDYSNQICPDCEAELTAGSCPVCDPWPGDYDDWDDERSELVL